MPEEGSTGREGSVYRYDDGGAAQSGWSRIGPVERTRVGGQRAGVALLEVEGSQVPAPWLGSESDVHEARPGLPASRDSYLCGDPAGGLRSGRRQGDGGPLAGRPQPRQVRAGPAIGEGRAGKQL